jgi:hypothetical protein
MSWKCHPTHPEGAAGDLKMNEEKSFIERLRELTDEEMQVFRVIAEAIVEQNKTLAKLG